MNIVKTIFFSLHSESKSDVYKIDKTVSILKKIVYFVLL